ncbi:phospholipase/lecithinase/hemolysin [Nitrosospira sp. Nsp5]|uniref:Phospholipase/lecithinase/hemolysin n=1 Tax=Nitrosospira multiformis TaxID=1231 RepID=A0ABY0TDG8_9PROT|nr:MULTISPECIES: SGNH/GDSL hydrolase family protein [Nitrosospira]PTR07349.1 phospholipase/lecithinase/hemolysin [Nitrosospira sp. Nsp5]SDQ43421.1 Phospholipase/lecithinase/hemolysin [Nitrosospira multiformis]
MRKILGVCLLLITVFVLPVASAEPPKYDSLYVFGDSLSDTGNDLILTRIQRIKPPIPPSESPHRTYYNGRFSNGPVAVEYLWRLLRGNNSVSLNPFLANINLPAQGGINFAFGGSKSDYLNQMPGGIYVPGALGQIELFRKALKGKRAKATALYTVWTGANDYLLLLEEGASPPPPGEVVANITQAIKTLHSLGARHFVVPNLPDLGLTPFMQEKGLGAEFLLLTQSHNALLVQALNGLAPRLPGIKIFFVDLFQVSQDLLNESENPIVTTPPAVETLPGGTGAASCFFINPATCPDVDVTADLAQPFAFWDLMHPTTFIHNHYGRAMFKSLQPKP